FIVTAMAGGLRGAVTILFIVTAMAGGLRGAVTILFIVAATVGGLRIDIAGIPSRSTSIMVHCRRLTPTRTGDSLHWVAFNLDGY
ncbi:hypothetical protein, partial [Cohnella nanjingensis]|uniref:hypothetical protein n=1 Tax=Cohnella nanjingensis TaxID=1387779 RepID=UPI001C883638